MNQAAARLRPALPGPEAPAATPRTAGRAPPACLWLCLAFSRLPLEVRSGGEADRDSRAIVDGAGRVVQASEPAAADGVAPGLPLNAALALCPGLVVLARDEAAEQATLARLAAWAGAFTSQVSLEPPASLLLEIHGSLRLFGGLEALRGRIQVALADTGHAARDAVAPTPLAALWLARAGRSEAVTEPAALSRVLGQLPPVVTGWPEQILALLRSLGIETLADCLRLPRDGFARRIGRGPLADLDRALGRLPDPRPAFRPPPRYRGMRELAAETTDTARLARALQGLFAELEGFLRARQRAITRLAVRFFHLRHPATSLELGLSSPGFEAARFELLLAARLERTVLPAPVIRVSLEAVPGEPLDPAAVGLFGDASSTVAGLRLVERLRARLGGEAVAGLALCDEHRPERAWRVAEPGSSSGIRPVTPAVEGHRPTWLLAAPRPLPDRAGRPWFEGALAIEHGPERLETGWWDGEEIARDYWIARTVSGARLWIFKDQAHGGRWFLHGVFG